MRTLSLLKLKLFKYGLRGYSKEKNIVNIHSIDILSVHRNSYFRNFPEDVSYTGLPLLWTIRPFLSMNRFIFSTFFNSIAFWKSIVCSRVSSSCFRIKASISLWLVSSIFLTCCLKWFGVVDALLRQCFTAQVGLPLDSEFLLLIILILLILTQRPKHEKMYANNHPNCSQVLFLWGGGNFGIGGNLWWYDTERSENALTSYSEDLTVILCL